MAGGEGAAASRAPAARLPAGRPAVPSVRRPARIERVVAARPDGPPMTLTAFLLARIAEDEAAAAVAAGGAGPAYRADPADPARVLAECRAKRRLVVLADEANASGSLTRADSTGASR